MEVVVSVVTYNSLDYLPALYEDYCRYLRGAGVKLVFRDNGSYDGSVEYISSILCGDVHLVSGENVGFGSGQNDIFSKFEADFYLVLNPDCRIGSRLIKELSRHSNIDIAAPNVYSKHGEVQKNGYKDSDPLKIMLNEALRLFCIDKLIKRYFLHKPDKKDRWQCCWVSGCAIYISRGVLNKINGFDESIFLYAEDEEFCWRARNSGFKVERINTGKVIHYLGWDENWKNVNLRGIMFDSHKYVYSKIYSDSYFRLKMLLLANLIRYLFRRI